jgi:hypothetical protein
MQTKPLASLSCLWPLQSTRWLGRRLLWLERENNTIELDISRPTGDCQLSLSKHLGGEGSMSISIASIWPITLPSMVKLTFHFFGADGPSFTSVGGSMPLSTMITWKLGACGEGWGEAGQWAAICVDRDRRTDHWFPCASAWPQWCYRCRCWCSR